MSSRVIIISHTTKSIASIIVSYDVLYKLCRKVTQRIILNTNFDVVKKAVSNNLSITLLTVCIRRQILVLTK